MKSIVISLAISLAFLLVACAPSPEVETKEPEITLADQRLALDVLNTSRAKR